MSGEPEAVGDLITGTTAATIVEGGLTTQVQAEHASHCLNCQTALSGPYCVQCGQPAQLHRSLSALGHDILHGVFHFEGKIWRTLPELLLRPGQLTRRYIAGERARFVSPMALYLFSVFLMFAAVSVGGGTRVGTDLLGDEDASPRPTESIDGWKAGQQALADQAAGKLVKRRAALARQDLSADDRADLQADIARLSERQQLHTALARSDAEALEAVAAAQRARGSPTIPHSQVNLGWPALDRKLSAGLHHFQNNPDLLAYKLKSIGYKYSWALIPLSLPFLWLLFFWRRDIALYDHTVFIAYSISFMMLLVVAVNLAAYVGISGWLWGPALLVVPPWHLYRQLREAYGLTPAGARLRLALLSVGILVVLAAFIALLLVLGLLG